MKRFLPLLAAALALATSPFASAQPAAYPTQPIKWIVPYVAGGGTDNLARTLAEAMQPSLGQPLIIDNRPGASTNIGVGVMMQAKPDGYTIMQAENAALLFNEHMFAKLPYKPASDFTYIGTIGRFPVALVVHPDFPAKNVAEFVRYVKANPDKVSYASPGNGSPHHMAMELFKQKAGLTITHVPYKGAAPAMTDVMGGQVPTMMLDLASGLPIIKSGKVRVLALVVILALSLVLPPAVAPVQVVVVPIAQHKPGVLDAANALKSRLEALDLRVKLDDSEQSPGWKFAQYEMKGVPLRVEIGPKVIG